MEIGSWIWIFAVCTFSASAQTWEESMQKIYSTDCWNYGKNRSIFEAPGVQNFNDCGRWNRRGTAPWVVYLEKDYGDKVEGVLVSDTTIISYSWLFLYDAYKEGKEIKIYAGKCEDENDGQKCYWKIGLLQNKKLLNVKKVELKHGRFFSETIYVWQIEKLDLTPNLQPACLWNWDNRNDQHEHFYSYGRWPDGRQKVDFLPEQRCYSEDQIEKRECDLYGNTICTLPIDVSERSHCLFIEREERFYLRAVGFDYSSSAVSWLDLLPFLNEITSASVDLASMPKIPKTKSKKDFGPNQSFANCGRRSGERQRKREAGKALPLVTNGRNAVRGQHPWHASLSMETDTGREADSCGATLISKKVLVTAAHCLFDEDGSSLNASHVDVTLGMHNRSNLQEKRQKFTAASLVIHPGYNHSTWEFKDDIALVILAEEVNFNDFVRPICLWNDDYDLNKIAKKSVMVVGWGYTLDHEQSEILQKAKLKVVSYEDCFKSNSMFFSKFLRPTENFCAGIPKAQTGVCLGDSGGGLTFYDRGVSRRHVLRGVVSMGLMRKFSEDFRTCNPKFYALYTDVTNYMDWIVQNSPDINV
ncbi:transmembrane protease serine 2-like [Neocloeon triangulifer]|uniref:transmembrane protease serine 2-like n=1 Tax=Neocloeon triangulifer TaxID=2078957 RepID=UPI00286F657A|nr:transmembrane protease serine 2-like [Neocloeon triangulifer]